MNGRMLSVLQATDPLAHERDVHGRPLQDGCWYICEDTPDGVRIVSGRYFTEGAAEAVRDHMLETEAEDELDMLRRLAGQPRRPFT